MIKKILIVIALIVVVLGGTYYYFEQKGQRELELLLSEQAKYETNKATTTVTATDQKIYTMEEVSQHSTRQDCWMSINGQVLDVTTFVDKHPGGEAILQGCGKDATSYFNKVPGHMKGIAQLLLKKMTIGTLSK